MTVTESKASYKERALKSLSDLPPFSPVLNRLLASLAREDESFAQLAQLIEKDTVLAGNVLRLVNSALYGCRGTINSVSHAIAIMGLIKLRNTALGFSVSRMWKNVRTPRGWSSARFNLHSVAVAILTDLLAQHVPVYYPEGAFVSGLFHDIGKLLIATGLPDEFEEIQKLIQEQGALQAEKSVIGLTHSELSCAALEQWNLPRPIQLAVAYHHSPSSAPPELLEDYSHSLADLLNTANSVVNGLGISCAAAKEAPPSEHDSEALLPPLEALGIADPGRILGEFRTEYGSISSLF